MSMTALRASVRKRRLMRHGRGPRSHPRHAEGGHMSKPHDKPDDTRRDFLGGAAVVATGAGLGTEARAQDHTPHMAAPAAAQPMGPTEGHGAFFNDDDAATMAAFT